MDIPVMQFLCASQKRQADLLQAGADAYNAGLPSHPPEALRSRFDQNCWYAGWRAALAVHEKLLLDKKAKTE